MTTVHEMLVSKGHGFIAVTPEEFVLSAMKKMADKDIGSLLVMSGGKRLCSALKLIDPEVAIRLSGGWHGRQGISGTSGSA